MVEIRNLSEVAPEFIIAAFKGAFSDYAVSFDDSEIEVMLQRRGFCPSLSFAAFDNDRIVSFLLNGHGRYDGMDTCYDCGTGTLPSYRGLGFAGKLFQSSIPDLEYAGVEQYILEVLTSNAPAIALYRKAGFEISANYDCYNQKCDELKLKKLAKLDIEITTVGVDDICLMADFCDFNPSWQNSYESIKRGQDRLIILAAIHDSTPIGYCVSDPVSGDIAQIAVAKAYRRHGVASELLKSAVGRSVSESIKILNVDHGCASMTEFLKSVNFSKGLSQFAMCKAI